MRPDMEEALARAKDLGCSTLSLQKPIEIMESILPPSEHVWLACRSSVYTIKRKPGQLRLTPGNRIKVTGLFVLTDLRLLHISGVTGSEELHQVAIDQITEMYVRWGFSTGLVVETPLRDMEVTFSEKTARVVMEAIENLREALRQKENPEERMPEPEPTAEQAEDLERLYVLLQRGILTQEEYEGKKARLLGEK